MSIESRIWSFISRSDSCRTVWISRSDSVDLPWSMWATMEKLRMRERGVVMRARLAHCAAKAEGRGVAGAECGHFALAKKAALRLDTVSREGRLRRARRALGCMPAGDEHAMTITPEPSTGASGLTLAMAWHSFCWLSRLRQAEGRGAKGKPLASQTVTAVQARGQNMASTGRDEAQRQYRRGLERGRRQVGAETGGLTAVRGCWSMKASGSVRASCCCR
jgi:hypothetical protein